MTNTDSDTLPTILIIDDSSFNLQLVSWTLQENNYKTLEAGSGKEAFEILKTNSPDLILLDVMMPEMDGFEVCRIIKKDENRADIPVIFFTSLANVDDIVKGFQAGGVDYVTKPFNKEELIVRIKNHIDLINSRKKIEIQARELMKANALKDKMFSVIGHDLRSPVGSIKLTLDLLSSGIIDVNDDLFLETINDLIKTTDEAYNLLENLLGWAKSQSSILKVVPEKINFFEVVTSTIGLLKLMSENKKIKIENHIPETVNVFADFQMVKTILRNLLSNALKFTPENGLIEVSCKTINSEVEISVKDTGVGIPGENLDKIFDPYHSVRTFGTNNESGSGLGLILCKDFVDKNGGRIRVESETGKGSTFIFTLPESTD